MQPVEPSAHHLWLARFVGDWTWIFEEVPGAPWPFAPHTGTERYRAIGPLWVQGESHGEHGVNLTTFGYDPRADRMVGTFVGEGMPYLWVYEGALDAGAQRMELRSRGPGMTPDGALTDYVDTYAFLSDDERLLTSRMLGPDGTWTQIMTMRYRRVGT